LVFINNILSYIKNVINRKITSSNINSKLCAHKVKRELALVKMCVRPANTALLTKTYLLAVMKIYAKIEILNDEK